MKPISRFPRANWLIPVGLLTFFLLAAPPIAERIRSFTQLDGLLGMTTAARLSGPVVVQEIQRLNRLETCRYRGHAVVTGETGGALPRWMAGDRMLFLGQGEVVAGVDLARLAESDISVKNGQVTLRMPAPEILYSRLDNRESQVYERKSGFFTGPDAGLEGRVRLEAEERLREAALSSGLLESAGENARRSLSEHLGRLGFRDIRIL